MPGRVLVVDDSATVRRIVRAVLEDASYEVTEAPDGQQALEIIQRGEFDIALVDFVMPRLNGYQFAQAVRSIAHLRTLPIVLMSAKADQIGERFMRQTGAIDAITKPFAPDAILAVVAHALVRRDSARPAPTLVRDQLQAVPSALASFGAAFGDDGPERTQIDALRAVTIDAEMAGVMPMVLAQANASQAFVDALTRSLLPMFEHASRVDHALDSTAIADALTAALTPGELASLARELRAFDDDLRGPVVLEGMLKQVPLGEVLQLLRLQRQTGLLVVQQGASEVAVAFRDGNIDVALARNVSSEFLLGRYLMADGLIRKHELDAILATRSPDAGWLGEQLLRQGVIGTEDLGRALTRQTSEIIYEMLRWPDGRYRFEYRVVPPEAQNARLGLPVESMVLEGFRRVDEWRVIEQEVRSFDEVLVRDEAAVDAVGAQRLAREEQAVLEAIDGRRTVREVIAAAAMNSFDACRIVYRLLRSRLVRRRAP